MKKRDHDLLDYELRVDRMLKKIRRQCYGLDTPLLAVLPEDAKGQSPEGLAGRISGLLLFEMARIYYKTDPKSLADCGEWLYSIVLYLLKFTSTSDQIFNSLFQFVKMDLELRQDFFEPMEDQAKLICSQPFPPDPLEEGLLPATLSLLDGLGLLENAYTYVSHIRKVCT